METTTPKIRKGKKIFDVKSVLVVGFLVVLLVFQGVNVYQSRPQPAWEPFDNYTTQVVNTAEKAEDGTPIIRIGEDLKTTGRKCNNEDNPIPFQTVYSWVSVEPEGTGIEIGGAAGTRKPGCTVIEGAYPMPESVVVRTNRILDEGEVTAVRWVVTGFDDPVSNDKKDGKSKNWTTEEFLVTR